MDKVTESFFAHNDIDYLTYLVEKDKVTASLENFEYGIKNHKVRHLVILMKKLYSNKSENEEMESERTCKVVHILTEIKDNNDNTFLHVIVNKDNDFVCYEFMQILFVLYNYCEFDGEILFLKNNKNETAFDICHDEYKSLFPNKHLWAMICRSFPKREYSPC